ncbi:MAG: hypothetical protein KC425_00935 [Anaerolineales bacterium]|nr:hypothetical protein [Anaerolineales bacterium]
MSLLLALHAALRWPVQLLGVAGVVVALAGWVGKRPYARPPRVLLLAFIAAVDFNLLLGLILLFMLQDGFPAPRLAHGGLMLLAALVAHSSAAWRSSDGTPTPYRNQLLVTLISLLFLIGG